MEEPQEQLSVLVFRNTFWNFLFNAINRFGGLLFTVILARMLMPELFGIYSLALGIVLLIASAFEQGLNTTTTKYVSEALGKKKKEAAGAYFRFLFRLKIFIAGAAAILLAVLAPFIANAFFHKPAITLPLQIGAVYLFLTALLTSFISVFYSVKKVQYISMQETLFQSVRLALIFFAGIIAVWYVFASLAIAAAAALILIAFVAWKEYPFLFSEKKSAIDKKRIRNFFLFITVASVTSSFFVHIDVLIIGMLLPQAELIAFYQVASTIVISIAALITFTNVSLPVFTQLRGGKLKHSFNQFFHYSCIFSLPITFGLLFVAKPFIIVLFGAEYAPAILPLLFLAPLIFESATGIFFTMILAAKERTKEIAYLMLGANMLNVILNYVLILWLSSYQPVYGIVGAAIATLVSRYLYLFSLIAFARKKLGISPQASSFLKPFFASTIMCIFLFIFNTFFDTLYTTILEIILGAALYFVSLIVLKGITQKDAQFLKRVLRINR